jgi:hypothetical protein
MAKGFDTRAIRQAMRGVTARGPVGTGKAELPLPPPERRTAPVDDAERIKQSLPRHLRAAAGGNVGRLRTEAPWAMRRVKDV